MQLQLKTEINELHPDLEGKMIDGTVFMKKVNQCIVCIWLNMAVVDVETGLAPIFGPN